MNLKALKVLAGLGAVSLFIMAQDFIRFAFACRDYGLRAQAGISQLKDLSSKNQEALVVITGDRNRIPKALELLQARPQSWLLISGLSKKTSLAEVAALSLESLKNDLALWERIVVDSNATSTVENAEETEKILRAKNVDHMILITSDYHMLRALAVFKKWVSAQVTPYAVSSEVFPFKFLTEYWKWVAFRLNIY
ncbi:MAG: YdcF family protein [Pseudomonadota bacterium]